MTDAAAQTPGQVGSVAIACQGGGSHTAFTAGVLSQLLNSDELTHYRIAALSGTSGGAVCALLAWSALLDDDRALASRMLEEFWADNAAKGLAEQFLNSWLLAASAVQNYGLMPAISPYHTPTSTMGLDQFRQMLQRHVDFDRFEVDAAGRHPLLLLGAVDVMSGRFRAFNSREEQITADCVLASAAIPTLFRSVHVNGGTYWDGLFSQNPPVHDLLAVQPDELWVIQVNPLERATEPTTLHEIADRRNELSGNLSLYQELAFIEKIDELLEDGQLSSDGKYKQIVVRIIEMPRSALSGAAGSKLNRDPAFLERLIECGRQQADVFLTALTFERAWAEREPDALMGLFADDAEITSSDPFPRQPASRDRSQLRDFVESNLCESIRIDPVRKQIAGDQVNWSIRMRNGDTTISGVARVEISDGRMSSLRLGV